MCFYMKSIKIKINKLGAIQNSEIELHPLIILSGESGLGKSYLAFLIHYIYKLILERRISGFFIDKGWNYDDFDAEKRKNGKLIVNTKELQQWIENDAIDYLKKIIGNNNDEIDININFPFEKEEYEFIYKTELFELPEKKEESYLYFELDELGFRIPEGTRNLGVQPWSSLLSILLKESFFGNTLLEQTFMMAPGRGALLNVGSDIQDSIRTSSGMYDEFLRDWQVVKEMAPKKGTNKELQLILKGINGGAIFMENQNIMFQLNASQNLPIAAAASSVKELAPIAMLLDKYPIEGLSILFEEPEAHLHPSKQIAIADFIVQAVNKGAHMQITTHSDYFIRRINDRINLGRIKNINESIYNHLLEKTHLEDFVLDYFSIGAYLLRKSENGDVEVIKQDLENGIPYDTFHNVLRNDFSISLDISRTLNQIAHD